MADKRWTCIYTINMRGNQETDIPVQIKTAPDGTDYIERKTLLRCAKELNCTEYDLRSYRTLYAQTKKGYWYNLKTGIRPLTEN